MAGVAFGLVGLAVSPPPVGKRRTPHKMGRSEQHPVVPMQTEGVSRLRQVKKGKKGVAGDKLALSCTPEIKARAFVFGIQ